MYLIAIDVGIKNLAFVVYNYKTKEVDLWENTTICGDDKYMPYNNVEYMFDWVCKYQHYFDHAIKVINERQMRANMRIIESILHTMFYPICTVISARDVKVHFDLSTRNYRLNKKAAVDFITEQLPGDIVKNHEHCKSWLGTQTKKDDLADAMLLLLYFVKTTHNISPEDVHTSCPELLKHIKDGVAGA